MDVDGVMAEDRPTKCTLAKILMIRKDWPRWIPQLKKQNCMFCEGFRVLDESVSFAFTFYSLLLHCSNQHFKTILVWCQKLFLDESILDNRIYLHVVLEL